MKLSVLMALCVALAVQMAFASFTSENNMVPEDLLDDENAARFLGGEEKTHDKKEAPAPVGSIPAGSPTEDKAKSPSTHKDQHGGGDLSGHGGHGGDNAPIHDEHNNHHEHQGKHGKTAPPKKYPTPFPGSKKKHPTPYPKNGKPTPKPKKYPTPFPGGKKKYPTPFPGGNKKYPTPFPGGKKKNPTASPKKEPTPSPGKKYPTPFPKKAGKRFGLL